MALLSDSTAEKNRTVSMAIVGVAIGAAFFSAFILGPLVSKFFNLSGLLFEALEPKERQSNGLNLRASISIRKTYGIGVETYRMVIYRVCRREMIDLKFWPLGDGVWQQICHDFPNCVYGLYFICHCVHLGRNEHFLESTHSAKYHFATVRVENVRV